MKRNLPGLLRNKSSKGFTLIELLVVIGILAILLSIVLIAINPARQFGQANDTKRQSAVTQILNAVGAYHADNKGQLPLNIPVLPAAAAQIAWDGTTANASGDICSALLGTAGDGYIPALPVDPTLTGGDITNCAAAYATGYFIVQDANGRVTVSAPSSEVTTPITITR